MIRWWSAYWSLTAADGGLGVGVLMAGPEQDQQAVALAQVGARIGTEAGTAESTEAAGPRTGGSTQAVVAGEALEAVEPQMDEGEALVELKSSSRRR